MRADWINPFIVSTISIFDTMLQCKISRGVPYLKKTHQPNHEVSGLMGLSGNAYGVVVVSLSRTLAIEATRHLNGNASGSIDADVIDLVCEMTNIIAGRANSDLEQLKMRIGLPSMISGKFHTIDYPSGVGIISVPFDTGWGPMSVDASIKEKTETACTS